MAYILRITTVILFWCITQYGCVSGRKFRDMFKYDHHGTYQPILTVDFDKGVLFVMRTEFDKNNLNLRTLSPCEKYDFVQQEKWIFLQGYSNSTDSGIFVFASNFRNENSDKLRKRYSLYDTLLVNYTSDIFIGKWKKIHQTNCSDQIPNATNTVEITYPGLVQQVKVIAQVNDSTVCSNDQYFKVKGITFLCTNDPKPRKNESRNDLLTISDYLTYGDHGFTYYEANNSQNAYKQEVGMYDPNDIFLKLKAFKVYNYNPNKKNYLLAGVFLDGANRTVYRHWWKEVFWYRDGKLLVDI